VSFPRTLVYGEVRDDDFLDPDDAWLETAGFQSDGRREVWALVDRRVHPDGMELGHAMILRRHGRWYANGARIPDLEARADVRALAALFGLELKEPPA